MKNSTLPPMAEDVRYQEAYARLNELADAKTKVDTRIVEIELQLAMTLPVAVDRNSAHVEAALSYAKTGQVVLPAPGIEALQDEHLALRVQQDALKQVLDERRQHFSRLTDMLSREASNAVLPRHRALGERMLAALLEIDKIQEEETALERELYRNGYDALFQSSLYWPVIGRLAESSSSALWHRVREMRIYEKAQ